MFTERDRAGHSPHGEAALCEAALRLYGAALRTGRMARTETSAAPCLVELSLLRPDPWDDAWLRPVPPSAALGELLRPVSRKIDEQLRLAATLSRSLLPLSSVPPGDPDLAITVLEGVAAIQASVDQAAATATDEILTAQPGTGHAPASLSAARADARTAIGRGVRIRHIYEHASRYSSRVRGHLADVPAQHVQVRTTEVTVEQLIIIDRATAYVPASDDRTAALRISQPAVVSYLVQVYEVLWAHAVPLAENHRTAGPEIQVTAVQRDIARLLTEGHVDDVVARRMGISVRTCRSHIARLTQTLGATSRTHLGAPYSTAAFAGRAATRERDQHMCVTSNTAGAHAVDGLCESATALYATAVREGRVARSDLVAAPCLVRRALVHPDPNDDRWMLPLPAPAALTRLLIPFAREVSDHLSDAAALLDTLLPFASLAPPPSDPTITVIHGNDRIMDSLREASRAARSEVLTAQPGGNRMVTNLRAGLENAQAVIEAGGRLRHLYQHPVRYSRRFAAYLDHLGPEHLEVRTMEQAIDRLIVFDRETAYLPAAPGTESALVIRHPALVRYLVHTYEVLWARATPYDDPLPTTDAPVTAVQHSIARLLAAGHVDDDIARRMGISVRGV